MNLTFILFAVAAFLAVVLCLEGLYNLWASRHSPQARRRRHPTRVSLWMHCGARPCVLHLGQLYGFLPALEKQSR